MATTDLEVWTPTEFQYEKAREATMVLIQHHIAYFRMQERAGKTIASLLTCLYSGNYNVMVITKKEAMDGWHETISKTPELSFLSLEVVTYQQAWKYTEDGARKLYSKELTEAEKLINKGYMSGTMTEDEEDSILDEIDKRYDKVMRWINSIQIVILDECHWGISGFPFTGVTRDAKGVIVRRNSDLWYNCKDIAEDKPIIYITATPAAEGRHKLFNQFKLSSYNPISHKDPYKWWAKYGERNVQIVGGSPKETYKKISEEAVKEVEHLFITGTRAEAGHTYEPENYPILVDLDDSIETLLHELKTHGIASYNGYQLVADNNSKERTMRHQIEGGTVKLNEEDTIVLGNTEKIDAIKAFLSREELDDSEIAIMYNFVAERPLLKQAFPKATLKQASTVTGFNLYDKRVLFCYSTDYSATNHSQRTSRMCHRKRAEPIRVYHLIVEGHLSEMVYDSVITKHTNFTLSLYKEKK